MCLILASIGCNFKYFDPEGDHRPLQSISYHRDPPARFCLFPNRLLLASWLNTSMAVYTTDLVSTSDTDLGASLYSVCRNDTYGQCAAVGMPQSLDRSRTDRRRSTSKMIRKHVLVGGRWVHAEGAACCETICYSTIRSCHSLREGLHIRSLIYPAFLSKTVVFFLPLFPSSL